MSAATKVGRDTVAELAALVTDNLENLADDMETLTVLCRVLNARLDIAMQDLADIRAAIGKA